MGGVKAVGAAIIFIWSFVACVTLTPLWDGLVQQVSEVLGRPVIPGLTGVVMRAALLLSITAGAVYFFFGSQIYAWILRQFEHKAAQAPKAANAPSRGQPLRRDERAPTNLMNPLIAAGYIAKKYLPRHPLRQGNAATLMYEALRNGHIEAWGYMSNKYPPDTSEPRQPRVKIPPEFWNESTIEDVDEYVATSDVKVRQPWHSISKPDPLRYDNRERVTCYWGVEFEPLGVYHTFPER